MFILRHCRPIFIHYGAGDAARRKRFTAEDAEDPQRTQRRQTWREAPVNASIEIAVSDLIGRWRAREFFLCVLCESSASFAMRRCFLFFLDRAEEPANG